MADTKGSEDCAGRFEFCSDSSFPCSEPFLIRFYSSSASFSTRIQSISKPFGSHIPNGRFFLASCPDRLLPVHAAGGRFQKAELLNPPTFLIDPISNKPLSSRRAPFALRIHEPITVKPSNANSKAHTLIQQETRGIR